MGHEDVDTLTLAEAAKVAGVPTSALRHLAEERSLPGLVRAGRGHARVRVDQVPTFEEVEQLLQQRVRVALAELRKSFDRVQVELEAVGNDIAELEEDPYGPIGVDLDAFDSLSQRGGGTLRGALNRMGFATMSLEAARSALGEMRVRY
ncbi:hypothetical protein CHO01_22890 [Cellulomonas hominis]|uniref:DNA-binding transcriptional MerR regulator n=1 Tax=Cellulomonas hominis TaxID=156981 RepID=A0A511FD88_9CELL|nr:helix-turn-helix domain-containing protein [Cellulomonas hominis]MBB5474619.1 DNA-binding transcriptional MerR regulator [Cellulomonas hominis]NKY05492.1 hypothetical protein [Cellulomonas hominis]GEL47173.1 hypothetical protein CHO01_22890 [Cellulomonas hominis]